MLFSKTACIDGRRVDATPFSGDAAGKRRRAGQTLAKAGYDALGKETLCCGKTGRVLQARIFMGPVGYQVRVYFFFMRLKKTMNSILIAFIILLVLSNITTAVGWAVTAGKLSVPTGLAALGGPNAGPEASTKKPAKKLDPDEDESPAPRGDKAVAPTGEDEDGEEDDESLLDRVGSVFGNLKSAVMLH